MRFRKSKYKHKFDRFVLNNRWKRPIYSRSGSWVYFGIGIRFFSPTEYELYFNFFGLEFRWWFIREFIGDKKK
jgi:dolichyl-phosphate-mannose--protein O-mannosyl transferase